MIIINGCIENSENVILDSGFYFGKGLFETILVRDNPIFLKQHCERLKTGLDILNIKSCANEEYILECIKQHNINNCVLKVVVTEKNIVISTRKPAYKPEDYLKGLKVRLSDLRRNPYSHVTYLKSLNYTDNMLEKEKAAREGYDEVLFLNSHNELAEGSISNIFFVKDNRIFTPEVNCGILNGIVRSWILCNFEVLEGKYSLEDIKNADEAFLTNSVMGIIKISTVEGVISFENDQVCGHISNKYNKYICQDDFLL